MEHFPANNSYYDWTYDFRHAQSEAANYISKVPVKEKANNSLTKKHQRQKENPKTCPVCGVLINNPWNLTVHIRRHNNEKPYKCEQCPASFVIQYELKVHMRSHNDQLLHKCSLCSKMFKTMCGKRLHEDTHGMNQYGCHFCDEKFAKFTERRKHESAHKNSELKCLYCFKEFANLEYKKQHETAVHNKPKVKQKPKPKSSKPRTIPSNINRNNNFRCKVCSERFTLKKDYFNHVQKLHPDHVDSIFKICKICGKKFTGYYYVYHMKAHQGDMPYACSLCEYKTAREKDLKTHMRAHSSAKPFKCKKCGKSFKLSKSLKLHQDTHTGKKDNECSLCEKTFYTLRALEEHKIKVHFKKLEKCQMCGKEVSSKYMKTHIKNEHERSDDPVICEHCGKHYPNESKLKQHLITIKSQKTKEEKKTVTRICPYCDTEVSCRMNLIKHCKVQHPTKVFKCLVCNFTNLNINKYKKHLRKHLEDSSFELTFSKIFARVRKMDHAVEECFLCGYSSPSKLCMIVHKNMHGTDFWSSPWHDCNLESLSYPVFKNSRNQLQAKLTSVDVNVFCDGDLPYKMAVNVSESDIPIVGEAAAAIHLGGRKFFNVEVKSKRNCKQINVSSHKFLRHLQDNLLSEQINNVKSILTDDQRQTSVSNDISDSDESYVPSDNSYNSAPSSPEVRSVAQKKYNPWRCISNNEARFGVMHETKSSDNLNNRLNCKDTPIVCGDSLQNVGSGVKDEIKNETGIPVDLAQVTLKEENNKIENSSSVISNLKDKLQTFNGKQFLSIDDLCNLRNFDIQTIIKHLKS